MLKSTDTQYSTGFSRKELLYCPPKMSNKYIEQVVHQSRDSFTTANINLSLISSLLTRCLKDDLKSAARSNIQRLKNTLNNLNRLIEDVQILDQFELTVSPDKLSDVNLLFLVNQNLRSHQTLIKDKHLNFFIASNSVDTQLTSNATIANHIIKTAISFVTNQASDQANIKVRCEKNLNTFEISFCEIRSTDIKADPEDCKNTSERPSTRNTVDLSQVKLLANLLGGGLLIDEHTECSGKSLKIVFVDFSSQWPV